MKIESGCLVTIEVTMSDAQGNLLERADAPLVYLHGSSDIFPRIEAVLEGQEPGYATTLQIEPEDAFGEYDADRVHLVACDQLGPNVEVGLRYEGLPSGIGIDEEDEKLVYTVTDVAEDLAVLDGNHPLAGIALRFDLKVVAVERATETQLQEAERQPLPEFLRMATADDLHRDPEEPLH